MKKHSIFLSDFKYWFLTLPPTKTVLYRYLYMYRTLADSKLLRCRSHSRFLLHKIPSQSHSTLLHVHLLSHGITPLRGKSLGRGYEKIPVIMWKHRGTKADLAYACKMPFLFSAQNCG